MNEATCGFIISEQFPIDPPPLPSLSMIQSVDYQLENTEKELKTLQDTVELADTKDGGLLLIHLTEKSLKSRYSCLLPTATTHNSIFFTRLSKFCCVWVCEYCFQIRLGRLTKQQKRKQQQKKKKIGR